VIPDRIRWAVETLAVEPRDLWGAQIQFRHAVQDWVESVNFARSLRGWVRLTSTPQI
jgi:hypothetical protein